MSHIRIQVKNIPKDANRRRKAEMRKGNKMRSQPTQLNWVEYHRGRDPSPSRNQLGKYGHEAGPLGCERTLGAATPQPPLLSPTLLWRLHAAMLRWFPRVSLFSSTKPSSLHYIKRARAHLLYTHHLELAKLLGELVSLEELQLWYE